MTYEKKGKSKPIGSKQTYMFEQFSNGGIYEQELVFGTTENNMILNHLN